MGQTGIKQGVVILKGQNELRVGKTRLEYQHMTDHHKIKQRNFEQNMQNGAGHSGGQKKN